MSTKGSHILKQTCSWKACKSIDWFPYEGNTVFYMRATLAFNGLTVSSMILVAALLIFWNDLLLYLPIHFVNLSSLSIRKLSLSMRTVWTESEAITNRITPIFSDAWRRRCHYCANETARKELFHRHFLTKWLIKL